MFLKLKSLFEVYCFESIRIGFFLFTHFVVQEFTLANYPELFDPGMSYNENISLNTEWSWSQTLCEFYGVFIWQNNVPTCKILNHCQYLFFLCVECHRIYNMYCYRVFLLDIIYIKIRPKNMYHYVWMWKWLLLCLCSTSKYVLITYKYYNVPMVQKLLI